MFLCSYSKVFRSSHQSCSLEDLFYRTPPDNCFWVSTKRYWHIYRFSDKRKYKKDSYMEKKGKTWNREKQTQMPVLEDLAATVRVKAVGCFCRGAQSLMFWEILNTTLSEKVSTTGATHKNHELHLLPDSLYSHQTQNSKMKFWTDPMFLLPWRRTHPLGR